MLDPRDLPSVKFPGRLDQWLTDNLTYVGPPWVGVELVLLGGATWALVVWRLVLALVLAAVVAGMHMLFGRDL